MLARDYESKYGELRLPSRQHVTIKCRLCNHVGIDMAKDVADAIERLLLHDGEGIRVESLEAAARIIPRLKEKGFRFVTVSALLSIETKGRP